MGRNCAWSAVHILNDCLVRASRVFNPADLTRPLTFIEFKKLLACLGWTDKELVNAYYSEVSPVSPAGLMLRCGLHGRT